MTDAELRGCVARWLMYMLDDSHECDREMVARTLRISDRDLLSIASDIIRCGEAARGQRLGEPKEES